jgi:hypothetical protein
MTDLSSEAVGEGPDGVGVAEVVDVEVDSGGLDGGPVCHVEMCQK